eukprot:817196-Prymnesium_polylepis.1
MLEHLGERGVLEMQEATLRRGSREVLQQHAHAVVLRLHAAKRGRLGQRHAAVGRLHGHVELEQLLGRLEQLRDPVEIGEVHVREHILPRDLHRLAVQ